MKWDRSKGSSEPIAALNRMLEKECGEPLVDLRVAAQSVRLIRPQLIPFLRETAAAMLERASRSLPPEMALGVIDAWRPLARQVRIHDWMVQCAREAFPGLSHPAIMRKANRWAAPYTHRAPPGHCTGGAVDVFLVDANDEPLDMSSPFNRFEASPTYTYGLCPTAKFNRMTLVEAMIGAGFSNCRDEWWHYSYGDAGWAVRLGQSEAIYGMVEMDPSTYVGQEAIWLEAHQARSNPFLTGK